MKYPQFPLKLTAYVIKKIHLLATKRVVTNSSIALDAVILWGALNSEELTRQAGSRESLERLFLDKVTRAEIAELIQ